MVCRLFENRGQRVTCLGHSIGLRRHYVINLFGESEIEVGGGTKWVSKSPRNMALI